MFLDGFLGLAQDSLTESFERLEGLSLTACRYAV